MCEHVHLPGADTDQSQLVGNDQSLPSVQLQPRCKDRPAWALRGTYNSAHMMQKMGKKEEDMEFALKFSGHRL